MHVPAGGILNVSADHFTFGRAMAALLYAQCYWGSCGDSHMAGSCNAQNCMLSERALHPYVMIVPMRKPAIKPYASSARECLATVSMLVLYSLLILDFDRRYQLRWASSSVSASAA